MPRRDSRRGEARPENPEFAPCVRRSHRNPRPRRRIHSAGGRVGCHYGAVVAAKQTARKKLPKATTGVGLVLSGGGARGIAHIGVIRALLEHGVVPEAVAGASAGATVGALYAAGYTPAEMLEFFHVIDPYRLKSVAFGKPGIWDSEKYVPDFRRYFPRDDFASLKRRLFVVATDLLRGEARVFDSGPLVRTLLASSCVPMVFAPMEIDGRLYGDGGIVDNFPVQLLEGRCGVILGVHVNPLREIQGNELGTSLAVLERALDVGMFNKSRANFGRCDVVILPLELANYGMFDTKRLGEIEKTGYREAKRRMAEILRVVAAHGEGRAAPQPAQTKSSGA
ncbi:MAG: hypothetical protein C0502_10205 [Opitutus sp.]|nr:hypothetical protein [Opitutus sp.]